MSVLTATALEKTYLSGTTRLPVLRGVDLSVTPGESISIRGESGSGKSTLLNLLAALDTPDAGSLLWETDTVFPSPPPPPLAVAATRRARFLGIVFQSFYLIPELDARANVLMAARMIAPPDAAARARAEELLAKVGLATRSRHLPSQLSGGERQRVAIARALMNHPRLVLADEPTGNLDEKTGDSVIDLLLALCDEMQTALVLVTHNPAHAARCRRPLFLHEGRFA